MKSIAAHYLLLIYMLAMCKPVLPLVNDFLAHSFWKSEHIITVHHENGKDHLHTELKKAGDQSDKQPGSSSSKSSESVSVHVLLQNNYDFSETLISKNKQLSKSFNLLSTFLEMPLPPPKA